MTMTAGFAIERFLDALEDYDWDGLAGLMPAGKVDEVGDEWWASGERVSMDEDFRDAPWGDWQHLAGKWAEKRRAWECERMRKALREQEVPIPAGVLDGLEEE